MNQPCSQGTGRLPIPQWMNRPKRSLMNQLGSAPAGTSSSSVRVCSRVAICLPFWSDPEALQELLVEDDTVAGEGRRFDHAVLDGGLIDDDARTAEAAAGNPFD